MSREISSIPTEFDRFAERHGRGAGWLQAATAFRFDPDPELLLEPVGEVRLRVAAVGNIALIGSARTRAYRDGFRSVFRELRAPLEDADIGFANLEIPIADGTWIRPGRDAESWHDVDVLPALAAAGVNVVSLANTHSMDCGPRGLACTLRMCAESGIAAVGAGWSLADARTPARTFMRGQRVLLLAYDATSRERAKLRGAGVAPLTPAVIREDLKRWRPEADVLIVSAHWGAKDAECPPERVLELASLMAECGADLVLGHHPHVTQGFQRLGRTLVLFSLGAAAAAPGETADGAVPLAAASRLDTGVFTALIADQPGLEYVPLRLDADGIPARVDEARAEFQRRRIELLSELPARATSPSAARRPIAPRPGVLGLLGRLWSGETAATPIPPDLRSRAAAGRRAADRYQPEPSR
jgi:hypothetical protein